MSFHLFPGCKLTERIILTYPLAEKQTIPIDKYAARPFRVNTVEIGARRSDHLTDGLWKISWTFIGREVLKSGAEGSSNYFRSREHWDRDFQEPDWLLEILSYVQSRLDTRDEILDQDG